VQSRSVHLSPSPCRLVRPDSGRLAGGTCELVVATRTHDTRTKRRKRGEGSSRAPCLVSNSGRRLMLQSHRVVHQHAAAAAARLLHYSAARLLHYCLSSAISFLITRLVSSAELSYSHSPLLCSCVRVALRPPPCRSAAPSSPSVRNSRLPPAPFNY